ncbi:hypothetical protein CJU89_6620 [Yarrowia sp. B02]|nr:hypothetical protein CJU89_6620 [Yarrowia sp. B02]
MDRASTPTPGLPSRQNTPLHGKLFGHTSSSSVSSLGNTKPVSHESSSDSSDSDDTNASTSIYYESENDTRGRNPTPVLPTLLRRRSSLSANSSRRSSISEFAKSPTMEEWGPRSRRPSLLSTPSRDPLVQSRDFAQASLQTRDLSRDPFLSRINTSSDASTTVPRRDSFSRNDFAAPRDSFSSFPPSRDSFVSRDSNSPFASRDPPITPSIGSPSLAATSPADSPLLPEMAIRMVSNNRKNMKPKPKSFLRISRDLVEENAPLDCEMRHESAITCALREDAVEESGMSRDPVLPSRDVPYPNYVDYFEHVIDEHSDSDTARPKRKRVGDYDGVLKRRAVSPGLSSPIMSASPTGAKRSNRQVQDTSEEIQRMSL